MSGKRVLIAYYSQTGETRRAAGILAEKLGAELYEIIPDRSYDPDMWKAWDEAQAERKDNDYPALRGELPDLTNYDMVIIGGPVWGFTLANPVTTFLRETDFSGRTVSAFWTFYDHDEQYDNAMRENARNAVYVTGLALPRSVTSSKKRMNEAADHWIRTLS